MFGPIFENGDVDCAHTMSMEEFADGYADCEYQWRKQNEQLD